MITIKDSITAEDLRYPKSTPYDTGYLDVGNGHQFFISNTLVAVARVLLNLAEFINRE